MKSYIFGDRVWSRTVVLAATFVLTSQASYFGANLSAQDTSKAKVAAATSHSEKTEKPQLASVIKDPKQIGGEPDSVVQVANLIYAGVKSSQCFSDHFLVKAERETAISTSRRFHAVKLGSEEVYDFPLLIMTGEGSFQLPDSEREGLRRYLERGGFLLASAGCSSEEWNRAFRREITTIFPDRPLTELKLDHPVFHTVKDISDQKAKHGKPHPLEGISISGRLAILYSQDGLNDTAHTQGCCCCGGNEILNAIDINVNVLAYVLTY